MKTVLFQGDSITDASRSWDDERYMGCGYPTIAGGEITHDYPGQYKVLNRGISGNRIVDLYARIKSDIINLKPDIMSILLGVNDVWHEFMFLNGVDAEKFFKVYCLVIEEVKAALPDIKIMIMEPFTLKGAGNEAYYDEFRAQVEERAKMAKAVAEKYDLLFIPLQDKFDEAEKLAPADQWLMDGVHPTAAGHDIIKRAWVEGFSKIVQ